MSYAPPHPVLGLVLFVAIMLAYGLAFFGPAGLVGLLATGAFFWLLIQLGAPRRRPDPPLRRQDRPTRSLGALPLRSRQDRATEFRADDGDAASGRPQQRPRFASRGPRHPGGELRRR